MTASKPYVIVVGVDYSATSELALERAFELATERESAEVHIVNVVQTLGALAPLEIGMNEAAPDPTLIDQAAERLRKYADRKLQEFKVKLHSTRRSLFSRAVSHLRLDAPAHEIAQLASDLQADLVVVGTHGRRGVSRFLVGSVAEGVVRLAPCAVLVVRAPAAADEVAVPRIEPPCPRCLATRQASGGAELWCEDHRQRRGARHTYHQTDRVGDETNLPLVMPER